MHEAGKGIDIMSRLGKMTENMYSNQDRDGLRMEKLSARSADANMAEWDRLSTMKRGLKNCERNRLGRLKRILGK